jgi:hypothetical protein
VESVSKRFGTYDSIAFYNYSSVVPASQADPALKHPKDSTRPRWFPEHLAYVCTNALLVSIIEK